MNRKLSRPGVSRQQRISDEGLLRLQNQLATGIRVNAPVLSQWIRRYGDPARELIKQYGLYTDELESG